MDHFQMENKPASKMFFTIEDHTTQPCPLIASLSLVEAYWEALARTGPAEMPKRSAEIDPLAGSRARWSNAFLFCFIGAGGPGVARQRIAGKPFAMICSGQ